jgi:hypothetical protein
LLADEQPAARVSSAQPVMYLIAFVVILPRSAAAMHGSGKKAAYGPGMFGLCGRVPLLARFSCARDEQRKSRKPAPLP